MSGVAVPAPSDNHWAGPYPKGAQMPRPGGRRERPAEPRRKPPPQARRGLRMESRKRPNGPPTPRGESHSFRGGEEGGSERHIRHTDPRAVRGENIKRKPSHRPTFHVWCGTPCPIRQSLGRTHPKVARKCLGREGGESVRQSRGASHPPDARPRSRGRCGGDTGSASRLGSH